MAYLSAQRGHRFTLGCVILLLLIGWIATTSSIAAPVSLMQPDAAWQFNNGQEFPGATGSLTVDSTDQHDNHPTRKLIGDFTHGGAYVSAGRKIDNVDIRTLSLWIRTDLGHLSMRINDASGQTHQIVLAAAKSDAWQKITFPLEDFFAKRGTADAIPGIERYETWGGAKDSQWHGPATAIYFTVGNPGDKKVHTLSFDEVQIDPRPVAVAGAEESAIVRLDDIVEGQHDWRFIRGEEFAGASGALTVVKDEPATGRNALRLAGSFTKGGQYVAALYDLRELDIADFKRVHFKLRSSNAAYIGLQLGDGSGQTHQQARFPITSDGQWHDISLTPQQIAGGEHWGGANDGHWHGHPTHLSISVSIGADKAKQPVIELADIYVETLRPVFAQGPAFAPDFSKLDALKQWTVQGSASIDAAPAGISSPALLLARTLEDADRPCIATSTSFPVSAGRWQVALSSRCQLQSPDNSYDAIVELECLDASGKTIDHPTVLDIFGTHDWQNISKIVEAPKGASSARIVARINKAAGKVWLANLSVSYLAPAPRRDDRITRLLFNTAALGNLLLPGDSRTVSLELEARKPLRPEQLNSVSFVVRDYWGAEQATPLKVQLQRRPGGDKVVYEGAVDLAPVALEVGKYYEFHAEVPPADPSSGTEAFKAYTSLAILPEAPARKLNAADAPFTARNWDNRIPEYIRLTDRMGVRICGLWGGWSAHPPYAPEAPGLDLCKQLGMGWLTNTPCAEIEMGKTDYSDDALRQGMTNLLQKFGQHRPLVVNLGNEPHGAGQRVLSNVHAYQTVYEAVKKFDAGIPVVATSVEPNEEYFKAGYQKYCDAYDTHVYEGYEAVRKVLGEYHELMKKYDAPKPIWSTELGYNCEGMTREVVAAEVVRTLTTFFAAGGSNASWFGFLYPDTTGKESGSASDSHNLFDCRFNHYAPRLDAVAYYNMVNGIGKKKFIAEKHYPGNINAFLFRDSEQHCLQVLWKDQGRQDISLPVKADQIKLIHLDGSSAMLKPVDGSVLLTAAEDPCLLEYDGGGGALAEAIGESPVSITIDPAQSSRDPLTLHLYLHQSSNAQANVVGPPLWKLTTTRIARAGNTEYVAIAPAQSAAREATFVVKIEGNSASLAGELDLHVPLRQ